MHCHNQQVLGDYRKIQMGKVKTLVFGVLLPLAVGVGVGDQVVAGIIISTPAGLNSGDVFRVVYVTNATTTATSSAISTYNTLVNTDAVAQAGGGEVVYNGAIVTFSAIVSTSKVTAIENIGQYNAPVYLPDGSLIATSDSASAGGLWSGSLLHSINKNLTSPATLVQGVWTGTNTSGTQAPSAQLGFNPFAAAAGETGQTNQYWVLSFASNPNQHRPIYAISQPLTVVPEPSSWVLAASIVWWVGVGFFFKRQMSTIAERWSLPSGD